MAFTKLRKVERCKTLLRAADVSFVYRKYGEKRRVRHQFKIYSRNVPLWLRIFRNKTFDTWLFDESADVFFDGVPPLTQTTREPSLSNVPVIKRKRMQ